ncbi:hypothetical protein [Runella salmonicolor]|uniref:Tetratricopeptide repeat protein n=1 Tax=Runella salmonicolor TaxID=2950278 RepID=A0ABT1G0J5_9BACT|nr:hypothetical protein [Runella salmonicolor]MCP1386252.1 hypothetical protein [Runella salmonicolor]
MKNSNNIIQFTDFLNGELSEQEAKSFIKRLSQDTDLAQDFEAFRLYKFKQEQKKMLLAARSELAAILAKQEETAEKEEVEAEQLEEVETRVITIGGQKSNFRWGWAVAACLGAGLIIFGSIKYNSWQKEKLANLEKQRQRELLEKQKQLQTPPVDLATKIPSLLAEPVELKGISDKMGEKMTALNDAIDEVAQQGAIKDLEDLGNPVKVPQERPTGETYGAGENSGTVPTPKTSPQITAAEEQYRRLLLGIGYLKENQLDKALANLNKVNSEQLQADVAWYKSLVLIQQKKYAEAKAELQKIESNPQYGSKAKELLGGIPQ